MIDCEHVTIAPIVLTYLSRWEHDRRQPIVYGLSVIWHREQMMVVKHGWQGWEGISGYIQSDGIWCSVTDYSMHYQHVADQRGASNV